MMKTKDETSIGQRAFIFGWFLGIFFIFLVSWVPRNGIAQEGQDSQDNSAWVPNMGNPVVALARLNDAIQAIEKPDNREIRASNGFFATTSHGHNYSRSYMYRFLDLLESRSNELLVVNTIKDEKFADFRKSLAGVKDDNQEGFKNHFDSFLSLLMEVRLGIIFQLARDQRLSPGQKHFLTTSLDPVEIEEYISRIHGVKSRAPSKGISCTHLL